MNYIRRLLWWLLREPLEKRLLEQQAAVLKQAAARLNEVQRQLDFQPALAPDWQKKVRTGSTYVDFESIFRDSSIIAQRTKRYLPLFEKLAPVLDIGCGRGEFLGSLREHDNPALGIDASPDMVAACRAKGLKNVEVAEALSYLPTLPERSQGGIFSCHVLEHMPVEDVIKFFPLAWRVLKPGGRLIVETPNPHSLPTFKLFWLDPTHLRPLYPEFLDWCARAAGFPKVEICYLTEDGFSPTSAPWLGNYALIATKE